ncbi:zinc finger and SCAN domain-containing protein 16-like isoform X2 [Sphaerodactylus townsendi]|uniref:zinc finger and SCAN domain-containing protein 16-like isoform X2 n=1 Tax=Sphaerodactylus townsendi TaxID=933632 RepID=UPI002025D797|nr:zinc finger and SCAN domain-containing protein 16-like isoform X2 [Sphaerodactylus townsendi]
MATSPEEAMGLGLPSPIHVKLEAQCQADDGTRGEDEKAPYMIQSGGAEEVSRGAPMLRVKQELAEEQFPSWDCQLQRVLEVVQTPAIAPPWDNSQLPPLPQVGNTEAYLTTFERVADASQWPREDWVTRLMPVLSGQAQQAYFSLDSKDKGDYGKVKVAILRLDSYIATETQRQGFRHFCYQDAEGPRGTCQKLQELCYRWLRPESQTKEQILDLLILEQFLVILPQEMQRWIRERGPETCDRAVALAEEFLQERQATERWEQQITVPVEMVIINSPIVDQALSDTVPRHPAKETNQADKKNGSSEAHSNFVNRTGAKEAHQGESQVEEPGRRPQGGFREDSFPTADPKRASMSELSLGRPQKSCLSVRVLKDKDLDGVFADPEVKRHLCKECGKRFRKKWDLIRHERIHTGEKPHQCTYCGKRFTRRSHVVNHQRRHSCQGRS